MTLRLQCCYSHAQGLSETRWASIIRMLLAEALNFGIDVVRRKHDDCSHRQAAQFASEKHRNQRRKDADASPYINHPLALANVLATEGGIDNPDVICAALLHDTIEDTNTTSDELTTHFGPKVATIVLKVTDDKSLDKAVRKEEQVRHAPLISPEAKLVKLADKICNLRDILASPPADWSADRKRAYFDWAARVVNGLRGVHPGLERKFDDLLKRQADLA